MEDGYIAMGHNPNSQPSPQGLGVAEKGESLNYEALKYWITGITKLKETNTQFTNLGHHKNSLPGLLCLKKKRNEKIEERKKRKDIVCSVQLYTSLPTCTNTCTQILHNKMPSLTHRNPLHLFSIYSSILLLSHCILHLMFAPYVNYVLSPIMVRSVLSYLTCCAAFHQINWIKKKTKSLNKAKPKLGCFECQS